MTDVHGRTFGVWTLLTCTLCWLCAFNLDNKPLYTATFLSFIYAFGHFLTEYLIYHTMAASNLTTVGIFAGITLFLLPCISFSLYFFLTWYLPLYTPFIDILFEPNVPFKRYFLKLFWCDNLIQTSFSLWGLQFHKLTCTGMGKLWISLHIFLVI